MRLQVFLSHNGVSSRRGAMSIIQDGRVQVNGKVVREPSTPVDPKKDKITVDRKQISVQAYDYIILHKPAGYVTTRVQQSDQRIIYDLLPKKYRHLSPVGRLDKDTEGLLFLTNDGSLAYKLTHPKFDITKEYFVRVVGELNTRDKQKLEKGIVIESKKTSPAKIKNVKVGKNQTEFLMAIHEGRKRQIRLMLAKLRYRVVYLKRLTQGPLKLNNLKISKWRDLTAEELKKLKNI